MQASQLAAQTEREPARTALHALHVELGARLVPFAGFSMPLNYPAGILAEHRHTREQASLFDVSHMSRLRITGSSAALALESLCPADIANLPPGRLRYTVLTNDDGGVIDDLIVRRHDQDFEIIANAARRDADHEWLQERIGEQCRIGFNEEFALLALQGPAAANVLATLQPMVRRLTFMRCATVDLLGKFCLVARAGYTGEDGFEISVPRAHAVTLARELLAHEAVAPAGLGARDGLRLEAGLTLYGHELDTVTSPVAAGLGWSIPAVRRRGGERAGGFPGSERILDELDNGPPCRLTGLLPAGRAPLRQGTEVHTTAGDKVGVVTSGGHSPTLQQPISLAYLETGALAGEPLEARLRGRSIPVTTTALPFVRHRYIRHQQQHQKESPA